LKRIILCNFGSPSALTKESVSQYLRQLLTDPLLIKQSLLWKLVLNSLVLPRRVPKVFSQYETIWLRGGAPLIVHTEKLRQVMQKMLSTSTKLDCLVDVVMRYSLPSIEQYSFTEDDFVLPLFPQYSNVTTGNIEKFLPKNVSLVRSFAAEDMYISTLSKHIKENLEVKSSQALLLSYHGLPLSNIKRGDPYEKECLATTGALRRLLGNQYGEIIHCYQSRFTNRFISKTWLAPHVQEVVIDLAKSGYKRISIICPSFITDCLETLVEIKVNLKRLFIANGGEELFYIPCLNEKAANVLMNLVENYSVIKLK